MVNRILMTLLAVTAGGGPPLGCAAPALRTTNMARVPMSYARSFDAPKEQTFRAAVAALERRGLHQQAEHVRGLVEERVSRRGAVQ